MSKGSMETRVERLENQVSGEGLEADLYDWEGNQVTDARVVKWPMNQARGVAIMADGSRREIAATTKLIDILRAGRDSASRELGNVQHEQSKTTEFLFLRTDGKPGMMETMCFKHHGREAKGGEV